MSQAGGAHSTNHVGPKNLSPNVVCFAMVFLVLSFSEFSCFWSSLFFFWGFPLSEAIIPFYADLRVWVVDSGSWKQIGSSGRQILPPVGRSEARGPGSGCRKLIIGSGSRIRYKGLGGRFWLWKAD